MRGDADDIRSYRYRIATPTGPVGPWPWKRAHEFLIAVFMAADSQFYDEAKESADEALRASVTRPKSQSLRGRSLGADAVWAIERDGEADCGHQVQREDCDCCLRTAGRYEGQCNGETLGDPDSG